MSTISIIVALLAAFILGISKAGLKGMGILVVTMMALVFGAKSSTGIVVPLLILGDIMAVIYYRRNARWKYLFRFLPWMILGVLVAVFLAKDLPEEVFKKGMALIILLSVVLMFLREKYDKGNVPEKLWFAGSMGFAAGFTTMIGNLAGAFTNIFFLATRIPKTAFIGTAAWLYFIVNLFKLPFHVFSWKTINQTSLMTDLYLAPALIIGFFVGLKVVNLFKEHQFRNFILVMTAVAAIIMLFR